jgi:hypothetical protein
MGIHQEKKITTEAQRHGEKNNIPDFLNTNIRAQAPIKAFEHSLSPE